MDDKADWIGYFLYDCECGKKEIGKGITINKKKAKFKTASDLYDVIVKTK